MRIQERDSELVKQEAGGTGQPTFIEHSRSSAGMWWVALGKDKSTPLPWYRDALGPEDPCSSRVYLTSLSGRPGV